MLSNCAACDGRACLIAGFARLGKLLANSEIERVDTSKTTFCIGRIAQKLCLPRILISRAECRPGNIANASAGES